MIMMTYDDITFTILSYHVHCQIAPPPRSPRGQDVMVKDVTQHLFGKIVQAFHLRMTVRLGGSQVLRDLRPDPLRDSFSDGSSVSWHLKFIIRSGFPRESVRISCVVLVKGISIWWWPPTQSSTKSSLEHYFHASLMVPLRSFQIFELLSFNFGQCWCWFLLVNLLTANMEPNMDPFPEGTTLQPREMRDAKKHRQPGNSSHR